MELTIETKHKGYGNEHLAPVVTVNALATDLLRFDELELTPARHAYWAVDEYGIVTYMIHDADNETGFGGSIRRLVTNTGEHRELKGCWSSRSSAMNKLGYPASIECSVIDERGKYVSAILVDTLVAYLQDHELPYMVRVTEDSASDIRYEIQAI